MGPKLVMIHKMTIDLLFFTYIILIVMIAYGVASRTMNSYATIDPLTFDGRSVFRNIICPTYYLLDGNIDSELQKLDANSGNNTTIATHILLAFHMLFVNILLINLIIVMFRFTFESVQTQTDLVWRYERYSLIQIIGANREVDKDWSAFESYATNHYARSLVTNQSLSTSALESSKLRQEIQSHLETTNQSSISHSDINTITEEMTSVRKAVLDLRNYSEEVHAMERVKMTKESKPRLKSTITTDDTHVIDGQPFL
ncbi:unnamed protein product [Rotaria socialis]|uniref:Uncharacterized protein n=1 Tax=Rotaria socialis TaxID=392032 RepID=A0A818JXV8_9BILA|nr:unnamed protein product [Rotaria socialis]